MASFLPLFLADLLPYCLAQKLVMKSITSWMSFVVGSVCSAMMIFPGYAAVMSSALVLARRSLFSTRIVCGVSCSSLVSFLRFGFMPLAISSMVLSMM